MDDFGKRSALLLKYPYIVGRITKDQKNRNKNQFELFDSDAEQSKSSIEEKTEDNIEEFSDREKLLFEKELLGFFLTDHPLNHTADSLLKKTTHRIANLSEEKEGTRVRVGGILTSVKKIFTKKNNSAMAFATLEDNLGFNIECVIFPKVFDLYKPQLTKDSILIIDGKLNFKDEQPVIIVESLETAHN